MTLNSVTYRLIEMGVLKQEEGTERVDDATPAASFRRLRDRSGLRPQAFADVTSEVYARPRALVSDIRDGVSLVHLFSQPFLRDRDVYPYRHRDGRVHVAVANPGLADVLDAIELTIGETVEIEVATFEDIAAVFDQDAGGKAELEAPVLLNAEDPDEAEALRDLASGAPIVRALDEIFERAAALRATDIHVEPQKRELQVRLRIDGVLRPLPVPRSVSPRALVSRIKILAGLNIAEQRVPQDGRLQITAGGRAFDIRLATMPTTTGEAAIMRLLDRGSRLAKFDELGFRDRDASILRERLTAPNGLVIVTGPTGSGKTTTLAASLEILNDSTRKILTIEDPVEYELPGIQQSQVRPAIGFNFASALRAFLRQDPDVIMVGEIRDAETARIAVQASLTGHLVLSTLHTNTAAAAITRLADIGIEPYLLASTLTAVIAQRLVRKLCDECRVMSELSTRSLERDPRLRALRLTPGICVGEPVGCDHCGFTGYRGRRAIFEVLDVTEDVRRHVLARADDVCIEAAAVSGGMTTLIDDGRARCIEGVTSVDEVFRVASVR